MMMHIKTRVNTKIIDIYYDDNKQNKPIVFLNTFANEGYEVWNMCKKLCCPEFCLAAISNLNWNDDLTPWNCPPLYDGDQACNGKADRYLNELDEKILPETRQLLMENGQNVSYNILAGYSLGGLFALYAGFNSHQFSKLATASASLWYPDLLEYVYKHKLNDNIECIYFSLGNLESKTDVEMLTSVEENTILIEEYLKQYVKTIYEENDGDHYTNPTLRMAKAIKWTLK